MHISAHQCKCFTVSTPLLTNAMVMNPGHPANDQTQALRFPKNNSENNSAPPEGINNINMQFCSVVNDYFLPKAPPSAMLHVLFE
jgi:hypothetical protein